MCDLEAEPHNTRSGLKDEVPLMLVLSSRHELEDRYSVNCRAHREGRASWRLGRIGETLALEMNFVGLQRVR